MCKHSQTKNFSENLISLQRIRRSAKQDTAIAEEADEADVGLAFTTPNDGSGSGGRFGRSDN